MSVVVASSLLLWVLAIVGGWIGYQLLRQGGRIFVRLEALDERIAELREVAEALTRATASAVPVPSAVVAAPTQLPLGAPAPAFELPDLVGKRRSLSRYKGQPVLLVFFNPQCGFCTQMLPRLAAAGAAYRPGHDARIVIITTGDASENRRLVEQHHISSTVLLQDKMEVAERYHVHGTPIGYLVDADGRIASDPLVGADALLEVWHQRSAGGREGDGPHAPNDQTQRQPDASKHAPGNGNRSLADSRLTRDGLKAGTPAPSFCLPKANGGGELDLTDYRGKSVLLVFSDPHCGPCAHVSPQLESLHRERQDLSVVMVSRGDVDDNRRKIDELGLTFPVALQKQWEISRLYGMFATPIGYLINPDGVLAADVAIGADAILGLAMQGTPITQSQMEVVT